MARNLLFSEVRIPSPFSWRLWIILPLASIFLWGSYRAACYVLADCFSPANIYSEHTLNPHLETSLSQEEKSQIIKILGQPFQYLDKGSQCYAFESADGKYVLKFFRYERYRIPRWISYLSFPTFLEEIQQAKAHRKEVRRKTLLHSCLIAHQELKEESGLLYVHLNKDPLFHKRVCLIDKIGRHYYLNIDEYEFILQKKANLIYPTLNMWIDKGEIETAKEALSKLLVLLTKRYEKEIFDNDPVLRKNMGFIGKEPIYIDIGQFTYSGRKDDTIFYCPQIDRNTGRLQEWLQQNSPELWSYFTAEIKKLYMHAYQALMQKEFLRKEEC